MFPKFQALDAVSSLGCFCDFLEAFRFAFVVVSLYHDAAPRQSIGSVFPILCHCHVFTSKFVRMFVSLVQCGNQASLSILSRSLFRSAVGRSMLSRNENPTASIVFEKLFCVRLD